MQLSAETFQQIVKSLRSDASGSAGEQRKLPRVGVRGRSSIMLPAKSAARVYPVNVRDISSTGIGLLMNEPLVGVGAEFVLVLPSSGQQPGIQMLCVVSRFNKLTSSLYAVGANFKHEIADTARLQPGGVRLAAQQLSKELLDQADLATVNELEERLKRLSA